MSLLFKVTEEIAVATPIVETLRQIELIKRLVQTVKSAKAFDLDERAIINELNAITDASALRDFDLDGTQGIVDAVQTRTEFQRQVSRIVEINRQLRGVHRAASRVFRTGALFLRQEEALVRMTKTDSQEVVAIVLRELTDILDTTKRLLDETKDAMSVLTDRIRSVDSWYLLHKQYAFLTLNQGNPR